MRQRSRTTEVMLAAATVRALEDNTLVLTHDSAPLARRLSEQRNADVIAEALRDALGVNWRVRCEVGAAEPAATPTPAKAAARRRIPLPSIPPGVRKRKACWPKPVAATRPSRAATPRKWRSNCCAMSWVPAASTTPDLARAVVPRDIRVLARRQTGSSGPVAA
ncbi:DNA-directed DNA polymerase III, gamma/tau [Mycobacterium ulcerans str. Harvey]|uniref:DNA-directed DNA polymerase III, gamma/tau n=1 Tax=Mycobacterium ulcerans str. Harvey TaxID=1299332 RepID=A0ABP3A8V1_MYCUL|nr:DNA-directed DNA polymerase III, gamma/tau [Mycobacterium ulcerans str. Harvey]